MTELEIHQNPTSLSEQMNFARTVVVRPEGGAASLLPQAYRDNPANVLLAVGLGQSMGLSPAESLYRIDVIQGKPTASAELIAANVRKAGHKLRLRVDEQAVTATCTIVRADDPDYEHTVTRDTAWAHKMGLATKDNYKKQPATMLGWRAVTACARMACPEALYGVAYSPDEMFDGGQSQQRSGGLAAALSGDAEPVWEQVTDVTDLEPAESPLLNVRSPLAKAMYAAFNESAVQEAERIVWISNVIGRDITSTKDMTEDEARTVLNHLQEQSDTDDGAQ